ncbi:MAG: cyclic nucleotide-binding domain-containing protein [Candidatus Wallbacteria bacterium]|nr:cyclic nucleotide-binding domain-containing protein [Candidatus Wallbacteria bacterium]
MQQPIVLPRGGVLFPTAAGCIQYGAVPETIKDTMVLPEGVPTLYVIPERLFAIERGISLAELEFPAYYNFFLKRQSIRVVCRHEQRKILEPVLREALFGPEQLDPEEFAGMARDQLPDLDAELAYFRRNPFRPGVPMQLEDLIDFCEFDSSGSARIAEGVTVSVEDDGGISIREGSQTRWRWMGPPPLPERTVRSSGPLKSFRGPLLGVSVIGSGHGFDPGNRTSGFIIWIESEGVMVDPPVDWLDWFSGYDIHPKQVDTLILTHCHADHDAGTLQKIMQEGRITIYATPTVMRSFVAKYSALTGVSPVAFRDLYDWVPVNTGEPVYLNGAEANFRYSLHSIPCTGFELRLRDKSLVYPSDTLNVPDQIRKLHAEGVLSNRRRDTLLCFPWQHTLVLHEAGIPPIHTPIDYLATLSEEVKARTLLVHVAEKSIPPGSNLKIAPTGLESTKDLGEQPLAFQEAVQMLDAMSRVEILAELSVSRGCEFLRMARRVRFQASDKFIQAGKRGDDFYILLSGQAGVWVDGKELKVYSAYDYIGETALVLDQPRTADVIARTDIEALALGRHAFIHLIRGTGIAERLVRLARQRTKNCWELLELNPVFEGLTANQKTQLEICMDPVEFEAGETLGETPVLIEEGIVRVQSTEGALLARIEKAGFAGDPAHILRGHTWRFRFRAETALKGFSFDPVELRRFLRNNPGVYLHLRDLVQPWKVAAGIE